jgi:hypothetical protein
MGDISEIVTSSLFLLLPCEMGESWAPSGAAGEGDEEGIRGLGLAESLGDSVAPDARQFTTGCPAAIPAGPT